MWNICLTIYLQIYGLEYPSSGIQTAFPRRLPSFPQAISLRTTRFNIKKISMMLSLRWAFLYGSQNRQRLLLYTSLTDWFL
jgi:hypothetical protein